MRQCFAFCILFISFSASLFAQGKKGYKITGHIDGLQEGEVLTMRLFYGTGANDLGELRDSGIVKNGLFQLSGIVPEGPRMYWMEFSKHIDRECVLWIDNNQSIHITGTNIDKIPSSPIQEYIDIDGSPSNKGREILVDAERLYLQDAYIL